MNRVAGLKAIKTKLLNAHCTNLEQFEAVQEKLNRIEIEIAHEEGVKKQNTSSN